MASLKLGLNQILGLIQANNVNIPAGDIDLGTRRYSVNTTSQYTSVEDISNTVIQSTAEGKITKLSQIANVYIGNEEASHIARHNGRRAIWVITAMKDRKNIVSTRALIEKEIALFEKTLPKGIEIHQAFDQEKGLKIDCRA